MDKTRKMTNIGTYWLFYEFFWSSEGSLVIFFHITKTRHQLKSGATDEDIALLCFSWYKPQVTTLLWRTRRDGQDVTDKTQKPSLMRALILMDSDYFWGILVKVWEDPHSKLHCNCFQPRRTNPTHRNHYRTQFDHFAPYHNETIGSHNIYKTTSDLIL